MQRSPSIVASAPAPGAAPAAGRSCGWRWLEGGLVAAAMALVVAFYAWTVAANNGFEDLGDLDYYKLLVRGWRKGQLHLDRAPAPELLALDDPYDPAKNEPFKLGDTSLYRNKYYIYFGPAPALTVMLPYGALTGREMTGGMAIFVFATTAFLAASALWLGLRRRFFPASGVLVAPLGVLALGFGTHLLALAQRPMFWELAIVGGIAFCLLAALAAYHAIFGRRPQLAMAAAGLCVGLAVASRPTCLFAALLLLVPVWEAWRARPQTREWLRRALAAGVPLALCGLAIMAHNHARFENPFEWGQNYQLSGDYEGRLTHFSARFLPHNLGVYFFHPLKWTTEFPFVQAVAAGRSSAPGYYGGEEVAGLAATFPFVWALLALPLAWWRRTPEERRALGAAAGVVLGYTLPVMALVMCYFSTTMRYLADFALGLAVLALVGLLALERWAQAGGRVGRCAVASGAALAVAVTVGCGASMALDYHSRSMQMNSPVRWRALERSLEGVVASVGQRLGRIAGPRVFKVRFQPQPPGTVEIFWESADARAAERIAVEHIGDRLIRFGYARGAEPLRWGRPLSWVDGHAHAVEVQLPSLYPKIGDGGWGGALRREEFRQRSCVAVWFSAGRALELVVPRLPDDIRPGGRLAAGFSGHVMPRGGRLYREDEVRTGLADPGAPRGGVLAMRIVFPERMRERGEPIFSGGAHYRSTHIYVKPAAGGLKLVFENYAGARLESRTFVPNPAGHTLEVQLATFNPRAFGDEATGAAIVRLDGEEMVRGWQVAYPFAWGDEQIGRNTFGTTCEGDFRGWICEARWHPEAWR